MTLPLSRLGQAAIQMAEGMNRAAASGSGNGYLPLLVLLNLTNQNTGLTITSTTDVVVSGVTGSFTMPRTGWVMIDAFATGKISAGATFAYGTVYIDGVAYGHSNNGDPILWDSNSTGYTNGYTRQLLVLADGAHTTDFRIHGDNGVTWINYQVRLVVTLLNA